MDKDQVIAKVKTLGLSPDSYIVFGSGPLAVAGIRPVNDIDILVSKKLFDSLKLAGWQEVDKGKKDKPLSKGVFEAHYSWHFSSYKPTLKQLLARAQVVQGVAFASMDDVIKWKTASGRSKDLSDLKLIKQFVN